MKTITPALYHDLVDVASKPGFQGWLAGVRATGGCAAPIHLWGNAKTIDARRARSCQSWRQAV
jgi:hypothetical protein